MDEVWEGASEEGSYTVQHANMYSDGYQSASKPILKCHDIKEIARPLTSMRDCAPCLRLGEVTTEWNAFNWKYGTKILANTMAPYV